MRYIRQSVVALLSTGAVILAACAPAAQPAAAPAPAAPAAPAAKPAPAAPQSQASPEKQPKYGGILVTFLPWNQGKKDPFYAGAGQDGVVIQGTYNTLLRYDFVDTGKLIPDLAERWEVSPDGLTYTFYLRKDVKWQDGKPFGAWDVQFTFDRTLDSKQRAQSTWGRPEIVTFADSWKTIDDYTFQIKLKNPVIYLPYSMASINMLIGPKHMFNEETRTVVPDKGEFQFGVGTGPFRIVRYEVGAIIETAKNPNFFRKGLPYLDGVRSLVIGDRATQVAAMASGRVTVGVQWGAAYPSEIKLIKEQAGEKVRIVNSYQNGLTRLGLNAGLPPTDNPKVRRAIFLAIDRWDVRERVMEGVGEVGTVLDSRIYRDWALPAEEVQKLPGIRKDKTQDIAEAKRLLAEAGYPNGFEVNWPQRDSADFIAVAQVVAAQLEKIGIKSKIERLESAAGPTILNRGVAHLQVGCCGGQSHALKVIDGVLQPGLYTGNTDKWNLSNQPFMDMYTKAVRSLDPTESRKLVQDMQRYLLTTDANLVPLVWVDAPVAVWNQVKNYYPAVLGFQESRDFTIIWLDQ